MKPTLCALFAAALLANAPAEAVDRKAECVKVKQQIRKLKARMRQSHTARQSTRWNDELRRLRKRRAKTCR